MTSTADALEGIGRYDFGWADRHGTRALLDEIRARVPRS